MLKMSAMTATLAASVWCGPAFAAHGSSTTEMQVQATLHRVEQGLASNDNATTISELLYTHDAVLLGEGDTHAAHGWKATVEEVREWAESLGPGGEKTCKFKLVLPAVASATTFSSFILLHCDANPPKLPQAQDLRMMYIWKKLPQGWRVQLEMWAPGRF
jgi:hypothetical protein